MSAKTTLTALTDALAAVKITADDAAVDASAAEAAANNALTAAQPVLSGVSYDPEGADHAAWIADFAAGKVVMFLPASNGHKTVTDTFFQQTTDKLVMRIGNVASTSANSRHIIINDGSADLIEITNGEFATLYRNGIAGWVKLPGIVGGVYPTAPV